MTGPEVTAAVRQGAEAFETAWNEALDAADQSDPVTFIEGVFRKALDAALDVEEMARPLCRRTHRSLWPIETNPSTRKPCANCIEHMVIIRVAILGADS